MYHASKWALEGFSQSLAAEVADFGITVTVVEPAGYSTDWGGPSAKHTTQLPAYSPMRDKAAELRRSRAGKPGDPVATREAILEVVDAENPPLRIFFGDGVLAIAERDYQSRLSTWHEWEPVSIKAHGEQ
jgi:NAD(P)-dependent dehydrogenase (short-subunit alcohol dehydrogenase family)